VVKVEKVKKAKKCKKADADSELESLIDWHLAIDFDVRA
jgi:hypothetical protein